MIRIIALLTAIFFLPATGLAAWQPELRVGLSTADRVTVKCSLPAAVIDESSGATLATLGRNKTLTLTLDEGKISINDIIFDVKSLDIRPRQSAQLSEMVTTIDDKRFSGGVRIMARDGRLSVINLTVVEEYLRGVVPVEMPSSWAGEALKAQALAARTFAMSNRKRHEAEGFDVCSTVHCQMFGGLEVAIESSDAAVSSTYGEVLKSGGKLINAIFHSDSGGMTEASEDVWGSALPYLRAVTEIETKTRPWTVKVPALEFATKLATEGKSVGKLKSVELSKLEIGKGAPDRTASGRVKVLKVIGDGGTIEVTGLELRKLFGLKSTLFDAELTAEGVVFEGFGSGHGVGMSQYGALAHANRGEGYADILSYYYSGVSIEKAYEAK